MVQLADPGAEYVLNYCSKHLSRATTDLLSSQHDEEPQAVMTEVAEAWRFPIVGPSRLSSDPSDDSNLVTFVCKLAPGDERPIAVLGTFATLTEPLPLRAVFFNGQDTGYRSLTAVVPKARLHTYKYHFEGRWIVDPINPQRFRLGNGRLWSRFFTDGYLQPIILEPWELRLLYRLMEQILPFRGAEATNFLQRYYFDMNREQRKAEMPKAFRLDESVGEVNAIDKFLAREEGHRLLDYRLCLKQIDRALRRQNPYLDPFDMSSEEYNQLYDAMAASSSGGDKLIPGWDYDAYGNPAFFLYILRRHAVTAAFCHPRYAGNVGAAGWAYLSETFRDGNGQTLFDWRPSMEAPLGTSATYR